MDGSNGTILIKEQSVDIYSKKDHDGIKNSDEKFKF